MFHARSWLLLYDLLIFSILIQVASFPFDDHNCPPIHLIKLFCQSAYSWLKEDILNVVVVHCKAGMARTGLMICSLLLFLKVGHDYHHTQNINTGNSLRWLPFCLNLFITCFLLLDAVFSNS